MRNTLKSKILPFALVICFTITSFTGCTKVQNQNVIADGLKEISVDGETDLDGNFYLSFVYSRDLIMLDGKGNIVWSKHEEQPTEDAKTGFWDFKKHEIDGQTYYSYHDQTGTYDDYGLPGYAPGERVILDENFHEINRITFEESDVTEKGAPVDGHDFLMISPTHYILSGYIKDTVYNNPAYPDGSSVIYSYLQEVDNGEVVWEFKSIDHPELYSLTVQDQDPNANDFANEKTDIPDYMHFNSMQLDQDGNLICSFRHINTILCLDRTSDQILWKLSGNGDEFGLTDYQKTSGQHYVTVDNNYITAFDNGNKNHSSRIVSYQVDTESKKLKSFKEYALGDKFSIACGSVQHITDEIYVIGWGWPTTDSQCMTVYDFSKGEELMTVSLKDEPYITYRCAYYE